MRTRPPAIDSAPYFTAFVASSCSAMASASAVCGKSRTCGPSTRNSPVSARAWRFASFATDLTRGERGLSIMPPAYGCQMNDR